MNNSFLFFPVYFFSSSFLFSQGINSSTFDLDADGWNVNGGAFYYHNSDGNLGDFKEFEDNLKLSN